MRPARLAPIVLGAVVVSLTAAPGSADKKMDVLQADVDEIQRQVFDLKRLLEKQNDDLQRMLGFLDAAPDARKAQAEFNANVEALRGELRALTGKFDSTAERLSVLERRVAQTCRGSELPPALGAVSAGGSESAASGSGDGALPGSGGAADPIQAAFQQAYGDYIKDNFDLAISEFKDFLQQHPDSDLADNAQYWVAMSHFNQRKYEDAIQDFDQLLARWPAAENAPEALYRKGLALLELNRLGQAVLVFNDVVSKHPNTPAATQAAERLKELASGER